MIEVEVLTDSEIVEIISRVGYAHLACCRDNRPYVVPVHYAYDEPHLYIYTTEGKKTEIIEANPEVCLQVEDVNDENHWQSVIITGDAVQLTEKKEISRAMKSILATNPNLTPAMSIHWMDAWVRSNYEVVYRITPKMITGRTTVERSTKPVSAGHRAARRGTDIV